MPRILFFGNLLQIRFVASFRFVLSLLWFVFAVCFLSPAPAKAAGPLSVGSSNPRFFVDSNGKAVYLSGVHLNNDLVDRSDKAVLGGRGNKQLGPMKVRQRLPLIPCLISGRGLERPSMEAGNLT